ncbi:stage V sporulation protein AE [Alkalibaculum sp. M08DMB]|uniref:Stage V sporulation protein AE n=1 Tax=Alkalibaculum sporogenes TaxID=2655001 RepID=A0A6A7KAG4_9FIRM|nr:stage V sporulation protein AE [Alkalibaculum sporogenes]MPW26335.1 stage V sporulation protein AE [Alkalibaculum sporogenes]
MVDYIWVFVIGGIICVIAQIIMDTTKLLPAHILVLYVVMGVLLTAIGIYPKIVKIGQAGATVPIIGFGYSLAKGTMEAVDKEGIIGAFSGGISMTASGISAAVVFGYLASIFSHSKSKK